MRGLDYDILIATDFRHGGGTTASIAQEIEVQARMGLRTGLIQVQAPHLVGGLWAERIRSALAAGLAEVVDAHAPARARLLLLRQPRGFGHARWSLSARGDNVLFIANQVPRDGARRKPYYVLADVQRRLTEELGTAPRWAPIGPIVRDALTSRETGDIVLTPRDWVNVLDAEAWAPRRPRAYRTRLVLGRHTRDDAKKWPECRAGLLGAYPNSGNPVVRILGGASGVYQRAGFIPGHWEVSEFGAISAEEFLADLDVYVYFHHSGMREAFCRAILEALASGLPVITHRYLERLFGDACVYAEAQSVPEHLRELIAEPASATNRRGIELVHERFDWEEHRRRLAEFFEHPLRHIARQRTKRPRVLWLVLDDPRAEHSPPLVALLDTLRPDYDSMVLSSSFELWAALRDGGCWIDYLPGKDASGLNAAEWLAYASQRVALAVRVLRPVMTVFLCTTVERALLQAVARFPRVRRAYCHLARSNGDSQSYVVDRDCRPTFDLEIAIGDEPESGARLLRALAALDTPSVPAAPHPARDASPTLGTWWVAFRAFFVRLWWATSRKLVSVRRALAGNHGTRFWGAAPPPPAPRVLVTTDDDILALAELRELGSGSKRGGRSRLVLLPPELARRLDGADLFWEVLPEVVEGGIDQRIVMALYGCAKAEAILNMHEGPIAVVLARGNGSIPGPMAYAFLPNGCVSTPRPRA